MRNQVVCICERKVVGHRLCFRYMDSTIHLLAKSELKSLQLSSVAVQHDLCRTQSDLVGNTEDKFSHDAA